MRQTYVGKPRRTLAGVLAWLCVAAALPAAEPEHVRFTTADSVTIEGLYFASDKGIKAPVVLMLSPVGSTMEVAGWSDLAKKLQAKGMAVLMFDFRGHGNSTSIAPQFWTAEPTNLSLKGGHSAKRVSISYLDFRIPANLVSMENDIVAAKRFLDGKNDASECNSAKLVVLGAGSGATMSAHLDQQRMGAQCDKNDSPLCHEHHVRRSGRRGAVWLSIVSTVSSGNIHWTPQLAACLGAVPVKDHVPTLFLFGEQDKAGAGWPRTCTRPCPREEKIRRSKT